MKYLALDQSNFHDQPSINLIPAVINSSNRIFGPTIIIRVAFITALIVIAFLIHQKTDIYF